MLNQLGDNLGYLMVIRRKGSYAWNTEIPLFIDTDEFEALCNSAQASENPDEKLSILLRALALYRGKLLPKLFSESRIVSIRNYYHNLYTDAVQTALSLLEERNRPDEVVSLCRQGIVIDPYSEILYWHLMRALLDQSDQSGAVQVYDELSSLLFSEFGTMPIFTRQKVRRICHRRYPFPSRFRCSRRKSRTKRGSSSIPSAIMT